MKEFKKKKKFVERRWKKMETLIGICGLDRSQVQTGYVEGIVKIT